MIREAFCGAIIFLMSVASLSVFGTGVMEQGKNIQVVYQISNRELLGMLAKDSAERLTARMARERINTNILPPDNSGLIVIKDYRADDLDRIRNILNGEFGKERFLLSFDHNAINVDISRALTAEIMNDIVKGTQSMLSTRLRRIDIYNQVFDCQNDKSSIKIVAKLLSISDVARAISLLTTPARFRIALVHEGPALDESSLLKKYGGTIPEKFLILQTDIRRMEAAYYLVDKIAVINNGNIALALAEYDEFGKPAVVAFSLNGEGNYKIGNLIRENIGRKLGFILDDKVIFAPVMEGINESGRYYIAAKFSRSEADTLSIMLNTAPFPPYLKVWDSKIY